MGNTILTGSDIRTVVCEVVNIHTGETIEPTYEAYGYAKFLEFVEFHKGLKSTDTITRVRGYGYRATGERVCLASEFVGVSVSEFATA
jgi:hypothetical protein